MRPTQREIRTIALWPPGRRWPMSDIQPPLAAPKNGHCHQIIGACRVSDPGPGKQDIRSNSDQENSYRELLDRNVHQRYEMTIMAGSGSGEDLGRKEYQKLIDMVATGRYDLVICEDLGRIV